MPSGPRVRENNIYGITSDNPLTSIATTMNSSGLVTLPVVAGGHAVLVLDPKRFFGEPEIVVVTSHSAFGTSATITRAAYGTTARSHPMNTPWAHIAVTDDYVKIVTSSTRPPDPYEGQIIYETDTNDLLAFNGLIWVSLISIPPGGHVEVVTSGTRPPTPYEGQVIYETDTDEVRVWDGDSWEQISGAGATILQQPNEPVGPVANDLWIDTDEDAGGSGGIQIYQQPTQPSSPDTDDLWFDIDESAGTGLSSILAYTEVVVGQAGITAEVDAVNLAVNITVPAGRRLRITGNWIAQSSVANDSIQMRIKEGATVLQLSQVSVPKANVSEEMKAVAIISPTEGSHTYKLTIQRSLGTGNVILDAGTIFPAYILVEDITGTLWPAGQSIGAGTIANEAWTPWTPQLDNATLGNGTLVARYQRVGRTVDAAFLWTFGSTSDITGFFSISLFPYAVQAGTIATGSVWMNDSSTGNRATGVIVLIGTTGTIFSGVNVNAHVNSTFPWDWAQSDAIQFSIRYEAAS